MQLATKNKLKKWKLLRLVTQKENLEISRCLVRELLKIGDKNSSPVTREKMESNLNEWLFSFWN